MLLRDINVTFINILPIEEANTTPNPMARGPPIVKNLSLGAHTATVDNPPTIPAV